MYAVSQPLETAAVLFFLLYLASYSIEFCISDFKAQALNVLHA